MNKDQHKNRLKAFGNRSKDVFFKLIKDDIVSSAAASSFFLIMSLFPFLLIFINLLHILPIREEELISLLMDVSPEKVSTPLISIISEIYDANTFRLFSSTVIIVIWSASQTFMVLMHEFDIIYELKNEKLWILKRLLSAVYTFIFMFVIFLMMFIEVYGTHVVNLLSRYAPDVAAILNNIVLSHRFTVPIILVLLFCVIYKTVPNHKTRLYRELPGAIIVTIGFQLFSHLYSHMVDTSTTFPIMYGSLANLVFALFWLYVTFLIIYFGAEVNFYLRKK